MDRETLRRWLDQRIHADRVMLEHVPTGTVALSVLRAELKGRKDAWEELRAKLDGDGVGVPGAV